MRVRQSLSWLVALLVATALVAGTAGSAAAAEPVDTGTVETGSTIGASSVAYHCWTPVPVGVLAIFEYAERLSEPPSLHTCSPTGPTFPV
jgi:hypothetical protein